MQVFLSNFKERVMLSTVCLRWLHMWYEGGCEQIKWTETPCHVDSSWPQKRLKWDSAWAVATFEGTTQQSYSKITCEFLSSRNNSAFQRHLFQDHLSKWVQHGIHLGPKQCLMKRERKTSSTKHYLSCSILSTTSVVSTVSSIPNFIVCKYSDDISCHSFSPHYNHKFTFHHQ